MNTDSFRRHSIFLLFATFIGSVATVKHCSAAEVANGQAKPADIHYVMIEQGREEAPRNDTASVTEIAPGHLYMVYHRYRPSAEVGGDFGVCSIWRKESHDGGRSWGDAKEIVAPTDEDINVQAPAICRLPSGELLLLANHVHGKSSTTMELHRSKNKGQTWEFDQALWKKSNGQWLQGGASQLLLLTNGRLIMGVHGGSGTQGKQKNDAWCLFSDDEGRTWQRSKDTIVLPMRGAMEASIAEMSDGELIMSLRTQLGGPFLTRSTDHGNTWSKAQPSGLIGPESCTNLNRIPGTDVLLLLWNDAPYEHDHHHFGERTPLSAAVSIDRGGIWQRVGDIETEANAEYTNLDCFFTSEGNAIITYLYNTPAWDRSKGRMSLKCAVIPKSWFLKMISS
jgi:sialidase-1